MKAIIFCPDSGNQYKEFQREAKAASAYWDRAPIFYVPISKGTDACRKFVLNTILAAQGPFDLVAFLCHGFRDHLQFGFYMRHVGELADAIASQCVPRASVPLYACSTGKTVTGPEAGEGGFADALRDALAARGMSGGMVLAHSSAGHLSRNPETRMFRIADERGGYDVAPLAKDRDLYRRFRGLLHTPNGRWEIATMDGPAIEAKARACEPYAG